MPAATSNSWFCKSENELPGGTGTGKRFSQQVRNSEDARMLSSLLRGRLLEAGVIGEHMQVPASAVRGIRDEEGAGSQMLHEDWGQQHWGAEDSDMPLTVLWACTAAFVLVWGKGTVPEGQLEVAWGDMVVLRGDWRHGGGGHCSPAFRVHGYVHPRGVTAPRYVTT